MGMGSQALAAGLTLHNQRHVFTYVYLFGSSNNSSLQHPSIAGTVWSRETGVLVSVWRT